MLPAAVNISSVISLYNTLLTLGSCKCSAWA